MKVEVFCLSYRKTRNATSSMSFFSLTMDNVSRYETYAHCCRGASACRSLPAVMGRFDVSLFSHAAAGVLSQKIPM